MNRQFFMVLGCVTLLAVSAYAQQSPPSGDADQQVFNNSCRTCHTTAASSGRCRTCNHGSTEVPSVGFAEAHDVLPLIVWLHRDALTKRLDAEIDSESDGAAALTQDARKQQENVVQGDLLVVERDEAALV